MTLRASDVNSRVSKSADGANPVVLELLELPAQLTTNTWWESA